MTRMAAYYTKTPTGEPNTIRIDQRTLTFVASIIGLSTTVLSLGGAWALMRYQIEQKADRTEMREMVRDSTRALDLRVTRNTETLRVLVDDMADVKQRTTDIACELVRPRRSYCR